MRTITIFFIILLSLFSANAQSLGRQVFSSFGGLNQGGPTSLTFTGGESIVGTVTASPFILTRGFQQPDIIPGGPFPVQWLEVSGAWQGNDAVISWVVIADEHVTGYEIEQSADGQMFHKIGSVTSAATQPAYTFTDHHAALHNLPVYYYRIKQIDQDGQYGYSATVTLFGKSQRGLKAVVYPNPASESVTVSYTNGDAHPVTLALYDLSGKRLLSREWKEPAGEHSLDIRPLAKGFYVIRLSSEQSVFTQRLTIR